MAKERWEQAHLELRNGFTALGRPIVQESLCFSFSTVIFWRGKINPQTDSSNKMISPSRAHHFTAPCPAQCAAIKCVFPPKAQFGNVCHFPPCTSEHNIIKTYASDLVRTWKLNLKVCLLMSCLTLAHQAHGKKRSCTFHLPCKFLLLPDSRAYWTISHTPLGY